MNKLAEQFASLSIFSDIDWPLVTREYQPFCDKISFPEYLQLKAENGDCPAYLYELAFYELALSQVQQVELSAPMDSGLHLNPTAAFLSLQFDINRMLSEAEDGGVEIYQRENVLCIFQHQDEINVVELDEDTLEFLQQMEDGPLPLSTAPVEGLEELIRLGLVISQ
jgi:hypothetical protein